MEAMARLLARGRSELAKAVVGQQEFIDQTLMAVLCGGHALVEGVPGIAKTLVVKLLARILEIQFQRVQATSDLMPADILGSNVLNLATSTFSLHRGPIFTELLLVDEINRMPRAPRRPCWRRWKNGRSPSTASAIRSRSGSPCLPRRTRWNLRAPIRCRKRNSTASC
jgi:hypothetical protein